MSIINLQTRFGIVVAIIRRCFFLSHARGNGGCCGSSISGRVCGGAPITSIYAAFPVDKEALLNEGGAEDVVAD